MPFLEGLLVSTRNLISDYGRGDQDETSDQQGSDSTSSPIHKGLSEDEQQEASAPRTIEQLEAAIVKTKATCADMRTAGKQTMQDQTQEIRALRQEMQQWETKLKKRQRAAYDVPYEEYSEYMMRPECASTSHPLDDTPEAAPQQSEGEAEEVPSTADTDAGPTRVERRLCRMYEAQLLKHLHLLMVAEEQLKIQSNIWNDIVLTMHEKPTSLDQDFMGTKLELLTEISTKEKIKTQVEQEGETKVRKQVLSMCKLKREVAREVKKQTSILEDKVFSKTDDNNPTQKLLRSLSADTFNSADMGPLSEDESKTASPDTVPPIPLLRQSSSLKLRLAREKAAARLADSKRRFNSTKSTSTTTTATATISINSDVVSLDAITENSNTTTATSNTKLQEEQRLSPSGVGEFPN